MAGAFADAALAAIEFPAALDQVSQYAVTPQGAARVRALVPRADAWWIDAELARVAGFMDRLEAGDDVEPVRFPDVTDVLGRLRLEGSVLEGGELAALAQLLAAARTVGQKLRRAAKASPELAALEAPPLPAEPEKELLRALEPDGYVKDEASRDLARLRRELVSVREAIVATLSRLLDGVDARHRAGDAGVTVRNGRYVVPVRREGRGRLGGIVHDESATHATLFVEPAETIELGNRLREVEADEKREVLRILRALTQLMRPLADGLDAAYAMLVAVDATYARARYARALGGVRPRAAGAGEPLKLVAVAHPLLAAAGITPVRFDLVLEAGERTVLISGPNTGGKTVLLKAVGLAAALAQSGVVPPLGPGSQLPVFDALFADIGDRQSIRESLSTFSAHVAVLRDILEHAGADALVLLDEMGTGTDPAEGAALAGAALRALAARGSVTVASTHLGALKDLAGREPGVVNASLQFDAATLTPTFRFVKGVPGRSYGLAIARRLGVDGDILAEAERTLPEDGRRLDAALAAAEARSQELERRAADVAARSAELEALREELETLRGAVAERERVAKQREKELERAAKHVVRDALLEARAEVERAISAAREGREKEARRALETEISALAAGEGGGQDAAGVPGPADTAPLDPRLWSLAPGLKVRIRSLGLEGEIESLHGDSVAVRVRGRRVRVPAADVAAAPAAADRPAAVPPSRS
jgi:DNA mismatch repair protein MutS2